MLKAIVLLAAGSFQTYLIVDHGDTAYGALPKLVSTTNRRQFEIPRQQIIIKTMEEAFGVKDLIIIL